MVNIIKANSFKTKCMVKENMYRLIILKVWPELKRYTGGWKNSLMDGKGILQFDDGKCYYFILKVINM